MGESKRSLRSIAPVGVVALLVMTMALACVGGGGDGPAVCDGVSAELGGCAPDRATYRATECEGIAQEFGSQLEAMIMGIIDGPESNDESKATRVGNALVVTAQLANLHVRRLGLVKECSATEFTDTADSTFSTKFKNVVGQYLHDGPAVDYATWRANLSRELSILDLDEDVPMPSPSPGP